MRRIGYTLDTGALIAIERGHAVLRARLTWAERQGREIVVPAAVLAQAWRNGARQVRLARFLRIGMVERPPEVAPLGAAEARLVGELCARTRSADIVDASVVVCAATRGHTVVTSDPKDMAALDPYLSVVTV